MEKIKCITFDKKAQDNIQGESLISKCNKCFYIPKEIRDKMTRDRELAKIKNSSKNVYVFVEGDDSVEYAIKYDNGSESRETDIFQFNGFSNKIHPFFQKQIDFAIKALKSKGIILNVTTVTSVEEMGDIDKGFIEVEDIKSPPYLIKSTDGNIYCLLRDSEMGRGWAVLYKIQNGKKDIIFQDHRDTVRDEIMKGDFIRSFGIEYERISLAGRIPGL